MSDVRYQPVSRVRLRDEIVDRIRSMIIDGSLKPEDKLPPERELARLFGVSRTAVREALRTLEATGLVKVEHGVGVSVTDWAPEEARGLTMHSLLKESHTVQAVLEARKAVEPTMARLAAERASREDLDRLVNIQKAMEEEIRSGRAAAEWDYEFHAAIADACKNNVLATMFSAISALYRHTQRLHRVKTWGVPRRPEAVAKEHARILEAILKRDPVAAERAALEHLMAVEENLYPIEMEDQLPAGESAVSKERLSGDVSKK